MLFDVLASPHRRFILTHMSPENEITVDELARRLVIWETDRMVTDTVDENSHRIRTKLVHVHLPKLADKGLIDYDREQGTVVLRETEALDAIEQFLELTDHL
nr:helix-turn-helix domain-containing protein [Haladaptatus sp. W1]